MTTVVEKAKAKLTYEKTEILVQECEHLVEELVAAEAYVERVKQAMAEFGLSARIRCGVNGQEREFVYCVPSTMDCG